MRGMPIIFVVCASLILAVSFGTRQTFGLLLGPMTLELGWSHGIFALAVAVQNLTWGLSQPFFGALADRFGLVRVLMLGAALYVIGLLIMALSGTTAGLHLGGGFLVGLGTGGTGFSLVLAATARIAPPERRSMALGIVGAGGSFGQFLMPLVAQGLIGAFGWYVALLALSVPIGSMAALAFGLVRADKVIVQSVDEQTLSAALGEAAGHRGYWLLNAGFFVCGFHVAFIGTHLPGYLESLNFEPMLGAWALAVIGLFNILGSLGLGFLGDRFRKKLLLSSLYFLRSLTMLGFLVAPPSEAVVLLFSAAIGLLWLGTVPLTGGLVGQIFGPRYMATLFGIVMLSHQVGAFFGAWIGGAVFDLTGSYDIAWILAIVLGFVSTALHLPIADAPLRAEKAVV